ncbi:unnamed protein product [Brassica oleracea]
MAEIRHIGSLSPEEAHAFRSDGCFTWWEELVSSSLSHVWVLGLVNLNAFLWCREKKASKRVLTREFRRSARGGSFSTAAGHNLGISSSLCGFSSVCDCNSILRDMLGSNQ